MITHLKTALAAIAVGAVALALTPSVAHADSAAITVQWAQTAPDNNGKILVSLSATSPITSISATLRSYATGQVAATVTKFDLVGGTDQAGLWEPTTRVKLPALGPYHIDLSVADQAGDSVTATDAGTFDYAVQTSFRDVTVDRQTVDIYHQWVKITGRFLGIAPDTGAARPLAGFLLHITDAYFENATVTTAADGTFYAVDRIVAAGPLQVAFPADDTHPTYDPSYSVVFAITMIESPTRIVERLSATRVPYHGTVSASGTLLWKSWSGWRPMANKTVSATGCGITGSSTTDAYGNVRFPAGPPLEGPTCTVLMDWSSDDPYKQPADASATVTVG
jgi:hypothetical protein